MNSALKNSLARLQATGPAPQIAVLLGTGWTTLAEHLEGAQDIVYDELPAFPRLGVPGHTGTLRLGLLGGRRVALLLGRRHAYETGEVDAMKGTIHTLAAWGVQVLVQTNAAGCLLAQARPGELMLITDHLNLVQRSPLCGKSGESGAPCFFDTSRFVDMKHAYDPALAATTRAVAAARGITLHEGVYAWMMGPQFETPAEIRWLRGIGADAVGMSTVPETILARHAGLRVLALSLFTNMAAGLSDETLSHAHTLAAAQAAQAQAAGLLQALLPALVV